MLRHRLSDQAISFGLIVGLTVLAVAAGDAYAINASVSANETTFAVGQTVNITAGLSNGPGLSGAADVYVGLLRPDNTIQFFVGTGIAIGNVGNLASFRPLATTVPLASPFSVNIPNFYSHQWTTGDLTGAYVVFVAAVRAGALAAGTFTNGDILALATAAFTLSSGGGAGTIQYRVTVSNNPLGIGTTVPMTFDYSNPVESGTLYTLTVGDITNRPFGRYDVCYITGSPNPRPGFVNLFANINGGGGPLSNCATVTISAQNPTRTFTFNFTEVATGGGGTIQYRVTVNGMQIPAGVTVPVAFDYSNPVASGTEYSLTVKDIPNQPFGRYNVCYRSGTPPQSSQFVNINGGSDPSIYCARVDLSSQSPTRTFTFNFR